MELNNTRSTVLRSSPVGFWKTNWKFVSVCVCCKTPACPLCMNHEVVEFQPRIVTDP